MPPAIDRHGAKSVARMRNTSLTDRTPDAENRSTPRGTEPRDDRDQGTTKPAERNPAGPHATPGLTDETKTPGSGMFPESDQATESPSG
ncbi:MAG: hypothetical protein ACOY6K_22205 [Pseudomonadota bacterium]